MTSLDVFTYADQQVRTVLVDGEPWFVAVDVCRVLDIGNSRMAVSRLDTDGVSTTDVIDSMGRTQAASILNEGALYDLIFLSRKPEAREFTRWVTREVLPEIRRTGQFGSGLPATFAEALELAAVQARQIEAREAELEAARPKVEAYDALMDADGYYSMAAVARAVGLGRTTLFRRLRELGILQRGSNLPYRQYDHHFKITTSSYEDRSGQRHATTTTRVRPTGLNFLRRKLAEQVVL